MVNLIACTNTMVIYGKDTQDGDVEIKFLEYTNLPDNNCDYNKIYYRDFKNGYRSLTPFETGVYDNFIFCRIGGNIYKIDIENKLYEVVETEFSGVCFLEKYILIAKDDDRFYKILPDETKIKEISIL